MRRLLFALAFAVPLVACGKSDEGNGATAGPAMTAEAIATNDVTAIDAVTGEAANMAADVNIYANEDADENQSGNAAAGAERPRGPSSATSPSPSPARPSSPQPAATQPAPTPEPQGNVAR
jgi:hypothetical protein